MNIPSRSHLAVGLAVLVIPTYLRPEPMRETTLRRTGGRLSPSIE